MKIMQPLTFCLLALSSTLVQADCRLADLYQTAPSQRFEIQDTVVIDHTTQLMWAKCVVGRSGSDCSTGNATLLNWPDALNYASNAQLASFNNWRLPNIKELASIIESACIRPALDPSSFPNPGYSYTSDSNTLYDYVTWSSTPYVNSALVRYVDYSNGADNNRPRAEGHIVRLVRDLTP